MAGFLLGGRMTFLADPRDETEAAAQPRRVLRDSVIVEVLNPKTTLFFLSFLPQFVVPNSGTPNRLQFLLLGIIVNSAFSLGVLASDGFSSFVSRHISSSGSSVWVSRISGSILIGISVAMMIPKAP